MNLIGLWIAIAVAGTGYLCLLIYFLFRNMVKQRYQVQNPTYNQNKNNNTTFSYGNHSSRIEIDNATLSDLRPGHGNFMDPSVNNIRTNSSVEDSHR